ncbi:hypothetical protein [Pelagovum pacificum]|uniref:Lipoprotein n=1 Tax=Pelagovum pacificum TaxID=2588711 RepID=A0A5C5GGN2_9RHOB|nr:hypothetical protein [Pelagovum pacificum]QQA43137.1 hypothetical protein I8N54_00745 [Pelagovum pacificum]TNY33720.1 hypothetical protein FHY64_10770 [Pelagovum pacificum]
MLNRIALLTLAAIGLTACAEPQELEVDSIRASVEQNYQGMPFAEGAISVIAPDRRHPTTYKLVPCRNGTAICAGSLHGHAGTVSRSRDFTHVSGAYYGSTFYLSPGGDGFMTRHGQQLPIAWAPAY